MTKIEHVKKLLAYIESGLKNPTGRFTAPPLPRQLHDVLVSRMIGNTMLTDRDVVDISFDPEKPSEISIFTALRDHHHSRKLFDEYSESIPVFDEFLDFTISVLRNRAHGKILAGFTSDEAQRLQMRVEGRLKELGL